MDRYKSYTEEIFMLNGFAVEAEGNLFMDGNGFDIIQEAQTVILDNGAARTVTIYRSETDTLEARNIVLTHPGLNIIEKWVEVGNISDRSVEITRIDSINGIIPDKKYTLKYFTSVWGKEFEPCDIRLEGTKILEVTAGRSSNGMHPWFSLRGEEGDILSCAVAWSGNWIIRFEPVTGGKYQITGGLSNWKFFKTLKPGESMEGIHMVYVYLPHGDISDTAVEFGRWGRKYCYIENELSRSMQSEYNTWWPYEDYKLSGEIYKANAEECRKLGIGICTLDAGWFGTHKESSYWYMIRGDWHKVNPQRFAAGIRDLADHAHAIGLKFGIWCEIEAAGEKAEINSLHPELIAARDGKSLGYVCMGNPETREWAFEVIERLICEFKADWIKLDFNLDPGAGCNRTDHGHGEGDGLYQHYIGYYALLDRIREKYPQVFLENCSSGGLRIDLGIMRHTHRTYLSDPDYTEHHLQVFWGAAMMLHPSACMHFAWSQCLGDHNREREPIAEEMQPYRFDYQVRAAMTGYPGFSYKMPQLPQWCKERLKQHIAFYHDAAQKFIRDGDMYPLTGQALRNGRGDRWNAFLYVTENKDEALLLAFRLPGGEKERAIRLKGLDTDAVYSIRYKDGGRLMEKTGGELAETGLVFNSMEEESSEIVLFKRKR